MSDFSQKIAQSRQIKVSVGHMTFMARRLTWLEYAKITSGRADDFSALIDMELVSGWGGVTENDLFGNGSGETVPFSRSNFNAAIVDMPEAYQQITTEIVDKTREFFNAKEANEKNSGAGTTKASENKK